MVPDSWDWLFVCIVTMLSQLIFERAAYHCPYHQMATSAPASTLIVFQVHVLSKKFVCPYFHSLGKAKVSACVRFYLLQPQPSTLK